MALKGAFFALELRRTIFVHVLVEFFYTTMKDFICITSIWLSSKGVIKQKDLLEPMQQNIPLYDNSSAIRWQILGEMELRVGVNANHGLDAWLKEILNPLGLHTDFLDRLLNSAHQTVVRLLRSDVETNLDHIHLVVFAPSNRPLKKLIWGFFSVEKIKDTEEDLVANNHTLEIYLYMEGDAILTHQKTP